jgi:hypothetical protein
MFLLTVQVNLLLLRLCLTKRRDDIIPRPVSTLFYKTTNAGPPEFNLRYWDLPPSSSTGG